jgi:hypothetical protein
VTINLHIERLIIEDMSFDERGKDQLSRAIKRQLLTHLTERGLPANLHGLTHQRSVKGGAISLSDSDRPANTGHKIGSAIYRGIGNGDGIQKATNEKA